MDLEGEEEKSQGGVHLQYKQIRGVSGQKYKSLNCQRQTHNHDTTYQGELKLPQSGFGQQF